MKGYFDALLRSTGAGAPGPVVTHGAPGVVELDQETRAEAMAPRATHTADQLEVRALEGLTRQPEPPPVAPVTRVAPIAPLAPQVAPQPVAPVARMTPQSHVEPAAARDTPMTASEAPTDLGQAMVRAAMRWVAADAVAQQVGAPIPEPRALHKDAAAPGVQTPDEDVPSLQIGHTEAAARPAFGDPAPRQAVTTTPAMIQAAPVPRPTPARDDVFEVSIGAIHVRVDAPAVQAVQSPQAPPAAPRATAARPQRSSLSRRALRRI